MNRPTQKQVNPRARTAHRGSSQLLGSWQLVQRLGEGQWTEVYQARPASSSSEHAADYVIKVLKPDFKHDPLAIQLLQREAFVARQVRHPHLTSVLSAHTDKSPCFVVMPYIEGISASEALQYAGRFTTPHALWVVRQSAEALRALHQEGWLHGDVKPANIIVSPNGHATLIDLGLSRPCNESRTPEQALTGSFAYAPPETFNSNIGYGAHSDLYSLGVTLYELLTATRPFEGEEPSDLAAAHLTRLMPDPRSCVPQLTPKVCQLLRHMLAKDPLRRPTISELIDSLVNLEVETFSERIPA